MCKVSSEEAKRRGKRIRTHLGRKVFVSACLSITLCGSFPQTGLKMDCAFWPWASPSPIWPKSLPDEHAALWNETEKGGCGAAAGRLRRRVCARPGEAGCAKAKTRCHRPTGTETVCCR